MPAKVGEKNFITAWILSLVVGWLGVDRFYLGKVGTGILKLLTLGGFGVWYIIDLIMIITNATRDKDGDKLDGYEKNKTVAIAVTVVVFFFFVIMGVNGSKSNNHETNTKPSDITISKAKEEKPKPTEAGENKQPDVPAEYKSALKQATSYANSMHMSKQGVYDQLVSQYGGQFSAPAAQYAIDNVKADWNANALVKAKSYQDSMHQSPAAIHDQLTSEYGEKFTQAEADYAIQHLND